MTTRSLRFLSYNIQVATGIRRPHHYVTYGWRHLLPDPWRRQRLDRIGRLLSDYDVVSLQEIDAGSYRSEFLNQAAYIANHSQHPHWHLQVNRRYGRVAQQGIALFSRFRPYRIDEHMLPGLLPGRGAIAGYFGTGRAPLVVISAHLSLGYRSRRQQLDYLAAIADAHRHVVILGDFNCTEHQLLEHPGLVRAGMIPVLAFGGTFPAWRPQRNLDHILVSDTLEVTDVDVLAHADSDHLPIAVTVKLPREIAVSLD